MIFTDYVKKAYHTAHARYLHQKIDIYQHPPLYIAHKFVPKYGLLHEANIRSLTLAEGNLGTEMSNSAAS